jgi:hypothetical protein
MPPLLEPEYQQCSQHQDGAAAHKPTSALASRLKSLFQPSELSALNSSTKRRIYVNDHLWQWATKIIWAFIFQIFFQRLAFKEFK